MKQQSSKRNRSVHQKQMRFFAIFFATVFLILFGIAFYVVGRWFSGFPGPR
jgi:uncharacterized BrkB/YihY/UPF0761 family membrane protein